MAFYLQIPGIKGSATDSQHKDWIGIQDLHFQTSTYVHVTPGQVSERFSSKPSLSDFVLTKKTDISSPKLFGANVGGKVFDKVLIHVCNSDQTPMIEYTLSKVIVSSYDIAGKTSEIGSHTQIQEVITLNAVKIEMRFLPQNGTPVSVGYDQEKAALD